MGVNIIKTKIEGVIIIEYPTFTDIRGKFRKLYNNDDFMELELNSIFKESYYSISDREVIRGMHFQLPPFEHDKLVTVQKGSILDVILDLRKKSMTFGKYLSIELSGRNGKSLFIPKGLAHGFKSLEDGTITLYNVSTVYNSNSDYGIKYDSFGFDWECEKPILSERDLSFDEFINYKSHF